MFTVISCKNLEECCSFSVAQSCLTLCNPMDCSTWGFPLLHHLLELDKSHVHWVSDAIQPSHPLSSPSPAANPSQRQSLFQWVNSSHEMAKVLELQLQHHSFQRNSRVDLLQNGLVRSPKNCRYLIYTIWWISISLMSSDAEQLIIYMLAICKYSWYYEPRTSRCSSWV